MTKLIASFQNQIIFIDKLLFINKAIVTNKLKKNCFDADGNSMPKKSYAISFHYDNGEISTITFSSEQERDDNYNKFLAGDFTNYLKVGVKQTVYTLTKEELENDR